MLRQTEDGTVVTNGGEGRFNGNLTRVGGIGTAVSLLALCASTVVYVKGVGDELAAARDQLARVERRLEDIQRYDIRPLQATETDVLNTAREVLEDERRIEAKVDKLADEVQALRLLLVEAR